MRKIAVISEHASPLALLGAVDSGGQNVYVAHLSRQLARLGCLVDIFTRCASRNQPLVLDWLPGVRVVRVPAGPRQVLPKEQLLPYVAEFGRLILRFMRVNKQHYDLVHANFFMSGMVAQQIKRVTGIPFAITFHALGRARRLYYSAADVFVTTPSYEPFGITPVEAMACAAPMIGSAVGAIKSTVIDGPTGYLVPPEDLLVLARQLARLQLEPQLKQGTGKIGLRRARRLSIWRRVVLQIDSAYRSVLSAGSGQAKSLPLLAAELGRASRSTL